MKDFVGGPELTLSALTLGGLAARLEATTLRPPFTAFQLKSVRADERAAALQLLDKLHASGMSPHAIGVALRLLEQSKALAEAAPRPSLVWSDFASEHSRDTSVVTTELFAAANRTVVLSTFSLGHKGSNDGNPVLRPLAERMQSVPELQVRFFLNVPRVWTKKHADPAKVERAFARWFWRDLWPWRPVPEVYFDPRSLALAEHGFACLHAKCVTIDDERSLVSSANLTHAAHTQNIEAGVLLDDRHFARELRLQFETLIARGQVKRLHLR